MRIKKLKTKELCMLAMLAALNVVTAEVMVFPVIPKVLELSFGFVPIAVCGMLFGPVPAMLVAVVADVIGAAIFSAGDFFLGYTLTALLTGLFYGLFLRRNDLKWYHVVIAQTLVTVICYAGCNTLWAYILGFATKQFIITRLTVNAVTYPIYILILYLLLRYKRVLEKVMRES